jgi:multiple sugar transport system ATP-binding protein
VKAVDHVSLIVPDRHFLTLLGPSGCGKTTILRMVAGLEIPTEGTVYIDGKDVTVTEPRQRDVAVVFQSYALYPHMTVRQNISFPLRMRKFPKYEVDTRVKRTAELLQITELLDRKPKQLSGGQQQRVALGRALVREPKVFLMDEPLSNLDAKLRVHMRMELKSLQKRIGITTIYVTHDQVEALTMSDTIVLLESGRIQQAGTPEEVYHKPLNLFVAGFVGTPPMNFLRCRLEKRDGRSILKGGAFEIDVSGVPHLCAGDSEVTLGIRSEDVSVTESNTPGWMEGEVYVVEPLGSEAIANIKIGKDIVKAKTVTLTEEATGKKAWVEFDKSKLHIFAEDGSVISAKTESESAQPSRASTSDSPEVDERQEPMDAPKTRSQR